MNQFIRYPCQSSQHMKFINRFLSSNKRLPVWFYVVGWSSDAHVSEILAYCKIWNGINIREISSCQQLIHTQNIFWSINYRGICTLSDWSKFSQILRVKTYYVPQKNLQQKTTAASPVNLHQFHRMFTKTLLNFPSPLQKEIIMWHKPKQIKQSH